MSRKFFNLYNLDVQCITWFKKFGSSLGLIQSNSYLIKKNINYLQGKFIILLLTIYSNK